MFAYCLNNPACRVEIGGYASEEADLDEQTKDELFPQPLGGGNAFDPYQAILDNAAPPNPYGRHGGMSHRALIESLRMLFEELGFDVPPNEKRVYIPETNNQYRYPDLIVDTGYEKIYVQVGKSTLSGDPIAREQRAIDDLKRTGNQVWFFCYDD